MPGKAHAKSSGGKGEFPRTIFYASPRSESRLGTTRCGASLGGGALRLRDYGTAEVAHLHEYREAIELAATRAACHNRTATDLVQLDLVCDEMDREASNAPSSLWLELDWRFHQTLVEASRNERFINDFDLLMIECNYVFYRLSDTKIPATSRDNPLLATLVHGVVEAP